MMMMMTMTQPPQKWHRGCAECCDDVPSLLEAWCLPCCYLGFISGALRQGLGGGEWDCGMCCAATMVTYMLGPCGFGLFVWTTRSQIVARYNIVDDDAGCPIACCCPICAMVQQVSHIKYRGNWNGSVCSSAELSDKLNGSSPNQVTQMGGGPIIYNNNGKAGAYPDSFNPSYPGLGVQNQQMQQQQPQFYGGAAYPPAQMQQQQQPGFYQPPPQGYQAQYYGQQPMQPASPPGAAPPPAGYGASASWNQATSNAPPPAPPQNPNGGYYQQQQQQFQPQVAGGYGYGAQPPQQNFSGAAPQNLPPPSFHSA